MKVLGKLYETSKCVSHLRLLISKVINEIEKIFLICPKQVVKFLLVPSMVILNTFLLPEKVLTIIQTNYVNTAFFLVTITTFKLDGNGFGRKSGLTHSRKVHKNTSISLHLIVSFSSNIS